MSLNYLEFDYSEDADGIGTFDALAATAPEPNAAVLAEVATVLAWAHRAFEAQRAPLDEGGEWDYDLQAWREFSAVDALNFDDHSGELSVQPQAAGAARHTVSLSVTGTSSFCAAFRERFQLS
jgi:VCBS repeat-containing protein